MQNTSVATPCCDSLIPMKKCCTGVVECPECDCEYRFSWCSRDLCDEDNRPRNHCSICQMCRDYRDLHCCVSNQISSLATRPFMNQTTLLLVYINLRNRKPRPNPSMVGEMVQNSQSLYSFTFNAVIVVHEYIYSHSTTEFTFKKYISLHLTVYFLFTIMYTHI